MNIFRVNIFQGWIFFRSESFSGVNIFQGWIFFWGWIFLVGIFFKGEYFSDMNFSQLGFSQFTWSCFQQLTSLPEFHLYTECGSLFHRLLLLKFPTGILPNSMLWRDSEVPSVLWWPLIYLQYESAAFQIEKWRSKERLDAP